MTPFLQLGQMASVWRLNMMQNNPIELISLGILLRLEKYLSTQLDDNIRQRLRNDLFQKWLMNQLQNNVTYLSPATEESQLSTEDGEKTENSEYSLK